MLSSNTFMRAAKVSRNMHAGRRRHPLTFVALTQSVAPAVKSASSRNYAQAAGTWAAQKVPMSNLESDKFVNYQRIEDNLAIVRKRRVYVYKGGSVGQRLTLQTYVD